MAEPKRPETRDQYRVAIICALPREADAMDLLFDRFWVEDGESDPYGPASSQSNVYTYGRIGHTDIVLVTLPRTGITSAAISCTTLRSDFPNIVLALLVGICGGVPTIQEQPAFLGDVVISSIVIQYDYGKQYPGHFKISDGPEDTLSRAGENIRGIVANLRGERAQRMIRNKAADHLGRLQEEAKAQHRRAAYDLPGAEMDCLFPAGYIHKHREKCKECAEGEIGCDRAAKELCADLGCDPAERVERPARDREQRGYVLDLFVGRIGSGNMVMKSGQDRDRLARQKDLIAFEMEGAGMWEELPCLVVKGICDYADSHKDKRWQDFASATAASVARALIEQYVAVAIAAPGGDGGVSQEAAVQQDASPKALPPGSNNRSITGSTFGNSTWINMGDISGGYSGGGRH